MKMTKPENYATKQYVKLVKEYVASFNTQSSGIWHTDEVAVKIKEGKEWRWMWNLMDHETRFLLASQLTKKREVKDVRAVFAEAKTIAKTRPAFVITDGLRAYQGAFKKKFFTLRNPRTQQGWLD